MKQTSTTQLRLKRIKLVIACMLCMFTGTLTASPTGTATIGDFVWVDQNGNGIQNSGEPGVANVSVKLLNASGTVVATATTNSSGYYSFTISLSACGQYRVQFGTPGQYTWTTNEVSGGTVQNNSNADANGLSSEFTICPGDNNPCLDAGIIQSASGTATIGDFVWVDQNSNGKQDTGEPGVSGVTVKLLNSAGTVVATATTNSTGKYMFNNVSISTCGQYKVQFGTPGQYTWTTNQASGTTPTNNSNADVNGLSSAFTICPGDYNMCLDAGIIQSTAGTATIGDFVWVDQNANGKQDSGEPGVAGVVVKLLNSAGTVVATATTNASGIYMFNNVSISSCGQYKVQFGTPGQYTWTTNQASGTTATNNSNADVNGLSGEFTICPGDYNMCLDAGILQSASGTATIGDFVWVDTNKNGRQDTGEPGVAGVVVKLLNSSGAIVATGTTNANGIYSLTVSLSACGQYRVQFGTPGQYTWTTKKASGSTVTNNSNADASGLSDAFTVCPGDYNMCLDAGICQSSNGTATIGDFVFIDQNNNGRQDANEPGKGNVTVKLLNSAGTVVATSTTNASGLYLITFPITTCGQYRVQFGNPGQYVWTIKKAEGTNEANNSNADVNGYTDFFQICPNDYNTSVDAGIKTDDIILAVQLTQFRGSYSNGVSTLTWTTQAETPSTKYTIERSSDGINFRAIGTVNGRGVAAGGTYNLNDNLPLAGANYYRLKIAEPGFAAQFSNVILLNAKGSGISIKLISGNPFTDQIKVNVFADETSAISLQLTDHIGRVVRTEVMQAQKGSNEITISDLSGLAKGVYNLEVKNKTELKAIKIMKN